jgi:hypothetical protein
MGNASHKIKKLAVARRRALVPGPPPVAVVVGDKVQVVLGQPLSGLDVAGEWQEYTGEVISEDALPEAVKRYPVAPKTFAGLWWVVCEVVHGRGF